MFYKITSSPRHGKLKRINLSDSASSSDNMTVFTNADILGEHILYVHDDSETTHDEFTFIASLNKSGAGAAAVESSFNISIELKNDEKPVRVVDKIFHVARNGQKLLTVEDLCYHDGDSDFDDGQLLYTRRGIPNGDLVLVNDTSHKLYQFHQEDLELRRVLFLHHGTDYGRFVLFVTDGKHYTSSLLEVSAHKPYIQIANSTGLLVQKGHAASFNVANFSVATNMDVRDDKEVTYKLFLPPKHGRLHINDLLVDSFTQHDLRRGHLVYQHDNSNNLVDRFNFTVKVKDVRLDAGVFVRVYLESHQRPPKVVHNRTLLVEEGKPVKISKRKLEVWVSSVTEITKADLNSEDKDSPPEELDYVITPPSNGHLALKSSANKSILNFTQAHVNNGEVVFVHSGSLTSISSEDLQAVTNDEDGAGNRTITFTLVSSPTLGRLVRVEPDNSTVEISTFTQAMYFIKQSTPAPPSSLRRNPTPSTCISHNNTAVLSAVVTEGEKVLIDKSKLDASNLLVKLPEAQRHSYEVWYEVTSLPQHGVITVGERNLTKEKPNFSQFILNKYGITYQHDNSESLQDSFAFSVWLNLKSKTASRPLDGSEVIEEVFNVTVTPVNDQPPELKTKAPGLRVVQGNKELLVPEHLNVVDLDNPPEDIKYTIISKPNNGFLAMGSSINESIMTFTQADINRGRVWFIQDGSTFSGVFYFSVTDGKHRPLYKLFNLEVTEITISLSNNTDLVLEQGQTAVVITNEQLAAETNGKNTTIHYLVTTPPQFGKLLIAAEPVTQFEQEDLLQGRLSYQMTNLTSSRDSFEFAVFTSESNLTEQVLNITVKPLITLSQDTRVPNEIAFKLRSSMLNATQLSVLSGSDPHFEIVVPPTHSKLLKSKKLNHGTSEPVLSFTFKDLEMGIVSLESAANMTAIQELNDSFTFVLHADSAQPAIGVFLYVIVPYDPSLVPIVTTKSPPLTTAAVITNQTALGEPQLPFPVEPTVVTKEPTKPVTRWKGKNRWGNPNRVAVPEPAVPDLASEKREKTPKTPVVEAAAHPSRASNPLLIILPLLACLLLVVILVVLIVVFRHRKEKQKPLIQNHPNNTTAPSSPSPCQPERSLAIPSVTVTPLLKGREVGAGMGPQGNALETSSSPQETSLQLCTWNSAAVRVHHSSLLIPLLLDSSGHKQTGRAAVFSYNTVATT
ncbi:UNVERIFIED_CONTAM: hypothetical protein FKN15_077477 [Acipenser sinensis]